MTAESSIAGLDRLRSEILQIWSRLLETSDLSIDDDFFDKGGDSLLATELMRELRQLTGKAVPDSLLFESSTVRTLAQRLSENESPQLKVAVRVGAASEGAKPLLFFHGDWTRGGFYVEHLARKLGPEFSLIAVAPHGPGGEPIPPSIEAMAADRLSAILAAQPTGPYKLAGHCVGGIVALETARLLLKLNHEVETVVMIDSPLMVDGKVMLSPPGTPAWGDDDSVAAPDDAPTRPLLPEVDWGLAPYTERLAQYSPAPLPRPVRLLAIAAEFDGRVWLGLSNDSTLQETHGVHFDLVTRRIDELADRMRSWLSGDLSVRLSARQPLARAGHDTSSSAGSSKRELQHSPVRSRRDEALAPKMSNKEIRPSQISPAKSESLSRRLSRFFGYARG